MVPATVVIENLEKRTVARLSIWKKTKAQQQRAKEIVPLPKQEKKLLMKMWAGDPIFFFTNPNHTNNKYCMKLSNTYRHHIFANHASTANFFFSGTLQYQLSLPKVCTLEFFSKVVLEEQGFLEIQRYHKKGPPHILPTYITLAWDINIESLTKKEDLLHTQVKRKEVPPRHCWHNYHELFEVTLLPIKSRSISTDNVTPATRHCFPWNTNWLQLLAPHCGLHSQVSKKMFVWMCVATY